MKRHDFATLREGDAYVCVDKTDILAKLAPTWTPKTEQDAKRYFLLFKFDPQRRNIDVPKFEPLEK